MSTAADDLDIREQPGGSRLAVRAQPGAARSDIVGQFRSALKVAVHAPPEKGAANKEIVAVLAKRLSVSRSSVTIVQGETSRDKLVAIDGLSPPELLARLRAYLEKPR
ncbi:MAG: DUF167 domain-containing protein [Planctomycetota bacterium]